MNNLPKLQAQRAEAEAERSQAISTVEDLKSRRGPLKNAIRNSATTKRIGDLEKLESNIAAGGVAIEQTDAEIIEIDKQTHVLEGEAEYAVALAAKERLDSIFDDYRVTLARRIDEDMDVVVTDFVEWDALSNSSAAEAETVGLPDSDARLVSRGIHISNYIRYRLEKFLGGDVPRSHRVYWQPFADIEADFARLTKQSSERVLRKLRVRLGLPTDPPTNGTTPSESEKDSSDG